MNKLNIYRVATLLLVVTLFLLCLCLCQCNKPQNPNIVTVEVKDTIYIDSIRIVEHCVPLYVKCFDTIFVNQTDTFVTIPITQYEYKDTIVTDSNKTELNIKYSGYKATLDDISINYQATKEVPLNQKKFSVRPSFNVGLYAGYGLSVYDKRVVACPQIGVGVGIGFSVTKNKRKE